MVGAFVLRMRSAGPCRRPYWDARRLQRSSETGAVTVVKGRQWYAANALRLLALVLAARGRLCIGLPKTRQSCRPAQSQGPASRIETLDNDGRNISREALRRDRCG